MYLKTIVHVRSFHTEMIYDPYMIAKPSEWFIHVTGEKKGFKVHVNLVSYLYKLLLVWTGGGGVAERGVGWRDSSLSKSYLSGKLGAFNPPPQPPGPRLAVPVGVLAQ